MSRAIAELGKIYYKSSHRLAHKQGMLLGLFRTNSFTKTWSLQTCIFGIKCLQIRLIIGIVLAKSISEGRVSQLFRFQICPKVTDTKSCKKCTFSSFSERKGYYIWVKI